MGTTLALPMLDAMVPALSAAAEPTPRFGFVYIANGVIQDQWIPAATGAGFELTPILQPFANGARPASTCSADCRICRRTRSATAPAITRAPRRCG